MESTTSFEVSRLIRQLRADAGLTQEELAHRVGTTQSVISRLESDDYEGHSLSMLYRIGAALNRKIAVAAVGEEAMELTLRESKPEYGATTPAPRAADEGLSHGELDRLADHLARRFGDQGVTKVDVAEAIRSVRDDARRHAVERLRGAIAVGPGDVADDIRRARTQRGREAVRS